MKFGLIHIKRFDRKPKKGEETSKSCLIYYFGTNYYETVDYSDIIRFSKGSRRREEGGGKAEEEGRRGRKEEGGEGRGREEEVDLSKIKKFFYGNQFLKALFSDFIGKIKEFNIPMERNSQFVITYKARNYHSRLVKLMRKGDADEGTNLYAILLK